MGRDADTSSAVFFLSLNPGERCEEIVNDVEGARRQLTVQYGVDTANRVVNACLYGLSWASGPRPGRPPAI